LEAVAGSTEDGRAGEHADGKVRAGMEVQKWIDSIVQAVQELPDRDSPEDQPEMMLVTDKELRGIIEDKCIEIGLTIE
jgi:20S proteasome alpha/beta subunit